MEPLARFMFSSYITVPVYEAFYRWLGYGEKIDEMVEAWNAKDRQKAAEAAPWDLIEEMFIFGEPEQMKERLGAFVEGGITLPVITPITTPDKLGELIDGASAASRFQKRTYSRSWPMPASIAWITPSGAATLRHSSSCSSYSRSLASWVSSCRGASVFGSAPKKSLSSPASRSS